jgi:hypothetical protein
MGDTKSRLQHSNMETKNPEIYLWLHNFLQVDKFIFNIKKAM